MHHRSWDPIPVSPPPTYSNAVDLQGLHQVVEDAALIAGQIEFAHPEGYKLARPSRVLLQRAVLRQDSRAAGVATARLFLYFIDPNTKKLQSVLARKPKGFSNRAHWSSLYLPNGSTVPALVRGAPFASQEKLKPDLVTAIGGKRRFGTHTPT